MDERFTATPAGRYWVVTDTETGAQWPYTNEDAARTRANAANHVPTAMRDTGQINTPASSPEEPTDGSPSTETALETPT